MIAKDDASDVLPPPRLVPGSDRWPVLLSVPHAGRTYPEWLVRLSRKGLSSLRAFEDPLVDRLVWRAQALGITCVIADAPRAAIDCNRAEDEIDPAVVNLPPGAGHNGWRVRAGLGLIPGRTGAAGDLWRRRIGRRELEQRLDTAYRPYHQLLRMQLDRLQARHREVVLLDCHSMPWRAVQAELVIGNRHGHSAGQAISDLAHRTATDGGFRVALNDPYAGGEIAARYGQPGDGVHTLQLELDRRCYLDVTGHAPGVGFDRSARLLEALARALGDYLLDRSALPLAAE